MDNKRILVIVVAMFMVISGGAILVLSQPNSAHLGNVASSQSIVNSANNAVSQNQASSLKSSSLTSAPSLSQRMQMYNDVLQYSKAHGIALSNVFIPNYFSQSKIVGGHITPGYSISPAPMGVGDYGLMNQSGKIVTYNYTTQSFEAVLSINQLNNFYLAANDAHTVTFQLNAVLDNVGLFGTASQMWTQNVVLYSSRTHSLTFEDNVWNFSSPATYLTTNAINYSSAQAIGHGATGGGYHYGYSKSFNMTYPFTVDLYLNTSVTASGNSVVWYNYTIVSGYINQTSGASKGQVSGNYDEVIFNSTYGQPSSYRAPHPTYLVSGTNLTPTGFIPYDSEIMIGGPGGGSTAVVNGINGTMNLMYYNNSTGNKGFRNVRAAYDIGSETGETSVGVDVHSSGSTAYLSSGPGLVYGLWNNTYSWSKKTITSTPGEAYMFLNNNLTMINQGVYAWAPLTKATSTFYLPSATYLYDALQNYKLPIYGQVLGSTLDLTTQMTSMKAMGVYTPIMVTSNSELASMAVKGAGTANNPYVINATSQAINPLFGALNDYEFPTFPGVLIMNTSDHVIVNGTNMPITYTGFSALVINFFDQNYGFTQPLNNQMQLQIYNSSNVSVTNSQNVGVWFSSELYPYFYDGSFEIWNSTNVQIYNNSFVSWGSSIMVYNPSSVHANITIYDNEFAGLSFVNGLSACAPAALGTSFNFGAQQFGIQLFSSYDKVYRNAFGTQIPVESFDYNVYCGDQPLIPYSNDSFNTTTLVTNNMNNWNLTGPLGSFTLYKSDIGNYWWNYNQTGAYNNYGMITTGQDNSPVHLIGGSNVTFATSSGALALLASFDGLVMGGAGVTSVTFMDVPAGGFDYSYLQVNAFDQQTFVSGANVVNPSSSTVVNAPSLYVHLTFTETGLAAGTTWSVDVNGMALSGNVSALSYGFLPGSYTYMVPAVSGYTASTTSNTISVTGATTVSITFTPVTTYTLTFTETGLASGTTWSVDYNGMALSGSTSALSAMVPSGSYTYMVPAVSGYTASITSNTITVKQNTTVAITFTPVVTKYTLTFTETGLSHGTSWSVTVAGHQYTTTNASQPISLAPGTYSFSVGNVSGYTSSSVSGTIIVSGNMQLTVTYTSVPSQSNTFAYELLAGGLVGGLVVGGGVGMLFFRKKP